MEGLPVGAEVSGGRAGLTFNDVRGGRTRRNPGSMRIGAHGAKLLRFALLRSDLLGSVLLGLALSGLTPKRLVNSWDAENTGTSPAGWISKSAIC